MECANIIRYQIFTIIFVKFPGYFFKILLNMVNVILTLPYAAIFIYLFIYLFICSLRLTYANFCKLITVTKWSAATPESFTLIDIVTCYQLYANYSSREK